MQRTTACSLSYFQLISRLRDLPKQVFGISCGEKCDCASPKRSKRPAQQLSALVDVVKLGARENGKVEAVDAQGIALAGIMGSLLRRAMRIVPIVFQHNSLSGPKPIAHHAAQSRGRPRAVGQCDRLVQKRRSQAQPSLGKQGERNDGYLGLHERPRLGKHLLRRRSGHLHARQTLCTGGKSRKAPR